MKLEDLKDKSILILGLGREGQATWKFLKKHFPGKKIGSADQADGEHYLDSLKNYDVIIKSPGIPYLPEIKRAQNNGKIITSATAIFMANCQGKVIGVTGTKGKSTTTALIYEILKKAGKKVCLIGNIGTPALDFLDQDSRKTIFVYELSSFQLEDLDVSPYIAVITNIYPEHLDHHNQFSIYLDAKGNIAKSQTKDDYLIYNQDIEQLKYIVQTSKAKKLPFSKKDISKVAKLIGQETIPLLGQFNLLNILPAVLVGKIFKITDTKIRDVILNFKPLPHRLEFVGEVKGIRFYNDSLSTIPQATIAALSALGKKVDTLIAGGFDRGIDYSILGPAIDKSKIKNLILFPTTGEKISKHVKKKINIFNVNNMKDAVRIAFESTSKGKIALLSPASSSFNLFKDYEDRGNQFKDLVSQY